MATIQELENRLNALEKAFLQAQKNQVPVTAKVDDTSNRVTAITPYTETKTAYIGDTEVTFNDLPQGVLSVWVIDSNNNPVDYFLRGEGYNITVCFNKPLEEVTEVSILIQ